MCQMKLSIRLCARAQKFDDWAAGFIPFHGGPSRPGRGALLPELAGRPAQSFVQSGCVGRFLIVHP
jgi:hypothetical protein